MPFDPNEYALEILVFYAAIISTYTLYIILKQTRPNIKVAVEKSEEMGFSDNMIVITALNSGRKPSTLTSFGIITPDGQKLLVSPKDEGASRPALPVRMQEGQACTGFFNLEANLPYLIKYGKRVIIQGFYRDVEKRDYISQPVEIELPTLPENVKVLHRLK